MAAVSADFKAITFVKEVVNDGVKILSDKNIIKEYSDEHLEIKQLVLNFISGYLLDFLELQENYKVYFGNDICDEHWREMSKIKLGLNSIQMFINCNELSLVTKNPTQLVWFRREVNQTINYMFNLLARM